MVQRPIERPPAGTLSDNGAHGQAEALAQLALFALRESKPDAVLREAVRAIAAFLGVELSAVLEVAPSGDRYLRRVWHGFREPTPHAFLSEEAGLGAFTLASNGPVVVDDLATETRFRCSALAIEGVVSAVCVPICGPGDANDLRYGTLFAGARAHRVFASEAISFMEQVSRVLGSVIYRRRTKELLRTSEERFVLLGDAIRDGALIGLSADGSIAGWNAPAERLFGWSAEEVLGKHVSGLAAEEDVFRGVVDDIVRRTASEDEISGEAWLVRKNATRFRATTVLHALRSEQHTSRGLALFVRDVTVRYEADAERARLRLAEQEMARERERLLEEANRAIRARDDVLAVVSHDLRNPISVIALAAEQLGLSMSKLEVGTTRTNVERIHRATSRVERIIGDLLDAASIEKGRLVVEPGPQVAATVVGEAVDAFGGLCAQQHVELRTKLDGLAGVQVRCDRPRIVQVLANLLSNALKFVPAGRGIDVIGTVVDGDLVISVHDEGPGIGAEHLAHVFDRYWQRALTDAKRGLGLGLAIVKGIVEAHGGRVWAESPPGDGATFSFSLPLRHQAAP